MPSSNPQPVAQQERIHSIDVIRGFALMGILVINIQGTAMPWTTVEGNPASYGDLSGLNLIAWWISYLFFNMKMINLFSMLFGAGLIVMSERWEARNAPSFLLYYRRTFFLLLIGTFHAYIMWDGDILFVYAWCAFAIYWFRKLPPSWLLALGLSIYLIHVGIQTQDYHHVQSMSPDEIVEWSTEEWSQTEYVQWALKGYRGDFWTNLKTRLVVTSGWHYYKFLLGFYWAHPMGMMLFGMALYKWGFFSATRSHLFYRNMAIGGFVLGLAVTGYAAVRMVQSNWDGVIGEFIGYRLLYVSAPLISLGWVGALVWIYKNGYLKKLCQCYASAGQMALTNYLMQTVIITTLFYGFGFGLYGRVDRWRLLLITLSVWIFQLMLSPIWLRRFRFGPVEWLWRSLTYWKIQAFTKRS